MNLYFITGLLHSPSFTTNTTNHLFFKSKSQTGGQLCSTVAWLSTEPIATVAWQLSRASGGAKWTDAHKKDVHGNVSARPRSSTHAAANSRVRGPAAWASSGSAAWTEETPMRLQPLKIIFFFSFSEFPFSPPPPQPTHTSAELGFLLTLALTAALSEAQLMYIQHLL